MEKEIKELCDVTIEKYRELREDFRYDGDYINHFAAVLYANNKNEIPVDKIKKIRTYIKENTSRMSCFRGDILYMISFLIGMEDNVRIFIEALLETYNELVEAGFKESQYLVLSSYALVKHSDGTNSSTYISRMMDIFKAMKKKYKNIINDEDYLECALLSISGVDENIINNYMDNILNSLMELDNFSKNSLQGLTLALLLNNNPSSLIRVQQLLLEFNEKDIKVSHQFLPLLAISAGNYVIEEYSEKLQEINKYLCSEEYEFEYYMDSSFRVFITISILEYYSIKKEEKFLNELIAMGVYSFITSKNNGIIADVLALYG